MAHQMTKLFAHRRIALIAGGHQVAGNNLHLGDPALVMRRQVGHLVLDRPSRGLATHQDVAVRTAALTQARYFGDLVRQRPLIDLRRCFVRHINNVAAVALGFVFRHRSATTVGAMHLLSRPGPHAHRQ